MSGPLEVKADFPFKIEIGRPGAFRSSSLREKIGTYTSTGTGETVEVYQSLSRGWLIVRTADHIEARVTLEGLMDWVSDILLDNAADLRAMEGSPTPVSQPPAQADAGLVVGPAGRGSTPPEPPPAPKRAAKPYKCSVCKRFGADVHVNCQYPGCPDGR